MSAMKDTSLNATLNCVARWLVGLVFLFSSLVKGVDPMGTTFKIEEYMTAWSIGSVGFAWAQPLAGVLSVGLICAEFLVGMLLVTNAYRRLSAWGLVVMMIFFTITTLIDALTNKVTDCGCFGDAVKLTNWQTFWKNIALDIPTVWIFLTRNVRYKRRFERDGVVLLASLVVMMIFCLYNINHEPVIDFRPWKKGNVMMDLESNAPVRTYLVYANTATGDTVQIEASQLMQLMQQPGWKEQWEWQSSRVVDPNEIRAEGFSMLDTSGEDHAADLLPARDGLIVVTIHKLEKLDKRDAVAIRRAVRLAEENGTEIAILTSALTDEAFAWLQDNELAAVDCYFADATAIKTVMRGNPGFMYIKDATVMDKSRQPMKLSIDQL